MQILNERPPIYDQIIANGLIFNPATTIFAYADNIYNPGGLNLPDHIIVHEKVHLRQQGHTDQGARVWWSRYFTDPLFRIQQEAEAYGAQYAYICLTVKDRNQRNRVLNDFTAFLAGPMYGKVISAATARMMIKNNATLKNNL